MTKLANVYLASRIAAAREAMIRLRDRANNLRVSLDGDAQDEVMVELVRPIVVAELTRRIGEIDADLVALGVDLS